MMLAYVVLNMLIYFILIGFLVYGFFNVKNFNAPKVVSTTKFSIIVPFRNENETLPLLLESFSKLNYPTDLFEVFLVNDDSTTTFELQDFNFKVRIIDNIRVSKSPKKDAILTAINLTASNWIVTTDADCVVLPNWLLTLDSFIQTKNPEMIVGAVSYFPKTNFLHHFQQLDMASLQGATVGSFGLNKGFMCNGANFAYAKKLFFDLNGFEGNNQIASGDDVFLLQKAIAKYPKKVMYLKSDDHIVTTKSEKGWKDLFFQRVRWASKANNYERHFGKYLAYVVLNGNFCWILAFILWVFGAIDFRILIAVVVTKFAIDFALLIKTQQFLKFKMQYVLLSSFFYPFFCVSVAFYSVLGKYEWKGRRF